VASSHHCCIIDHVTLSGENSILYENGTLPLAGHDAVPYKNHALTICFGVDVPAEAENHVTSSITVFVHGVHDIHVNAIH
jgi:hypothetical protein